MQIYDDWQVSLIQDICDAFGTWFQSPHPGANSIVCMQDALYKINTDGNAADRFEQLRKDGESATCYFGIPVSLGMPLPDWAVEKVRLFLATTFAGCPAGRNMDMAVEAIAWYGEVQPPVQLILTGKGGDGKSARTLLRQAVFGDHHATVGADIFQKENEFRIQACHFAFARVVTAQECLPGVSLLEDCWKNFVANGKLAGRPLFGKQTLYLSWPRCAKIWEMNKHLPRINGDPGCIFNLKSFTRRARVIEMQASFTGDSGRVNVEAQIFVEDPDLAEFLASPQAAVVYLKKFLFPFL